MTRKTAAISAGLGLLGLLLLFGPGWKGGLAALVGLQVYAFGWLLWGATAGFRVRAERKGTAGEPPEPEILSAALSKTRRRGAMVLVVGACLSAVPVVGLLAIPAVLGGFLACVTSSLVEPSRRVLGLPRRTIGGLLLVTGWLAATGTMLETAQLATGHAPASTASTLAIWWILAPLLVAFGWRLHSALPTPARIRRGFSVAGLFMAVAALGLLLRDVLPRSV